MCQGWDTSCLTFTSRLQDGGSSSKHDIFPQHRRDAAICPHRHSLANLPPELSHGTSSRYRGGGRERALTFRMSAVEGSPGGVSRGCLLVVEAMPCAGSVQGCPARAPSAQFSQGRICVSKSPFCWRKQKPTQANSERGTCLFRRCWKRRLWCLQEERVSSQAVWGGGPGPSASWRASEGAAVPFVRKLLLMGPARFYVSAAGQPSLSLSQVPEHQRRISMTQ